MLRIVISSIAAISLAMSSCGTKTSPALPKSEAGPVSAEVPAAVAPSPSTVRPSPTIPPPASALTPVVSPLRDLVARFLDSDGQGGWRKNEKSATELEKLSAEEIAIVWPLLKDPQVEVRRGAAVFLLGQLDPASSEQVATFTGLLDDSDRMVRSRALDAVKQFSRPDQIAVLPQLAAMLDPSREDRADNRTVIARLCGSLKSEAAPAMAGLQLAATSDPDTKVRASALAAIAQVADPQGAVSSLSKGLADKDATVRVVAAAKLRQLGPAAAPAAKELAAALADPRTDVAEAAAESLIRIGPPAVELLAGQLASKSAPVRKLALSSLARLGPVARPAASRIEKCKQDADPQIRQLAEEALKLLAGQ